MGKFDISKYAEGLSVPDSGTLREIPLGKLVPNPQNFYPAPQGKELDELIASILANGLLEPLTVVPAATEGEYRVISGHSRLTALRYAVETDARLKNVPCRVLPTLTEAQELCALIEANRQRVKSPALLAQEARQLTELYRKRKEAGEDLPGRIRERVAATLKVSPTKLGNVSAIDNGLKIPALRDLWALGGIPEDAALEIARVNIHEQRALHGWVTALKKPWTVKTVREYFEMLRGKPPADGKLTRVTVADELHPAPTALGALPQFTDGHETPPRAGEYWCRFDCEGYESYSSARWDAVLARWEFLNGIKIDAKCLGWYPLPERVKKEDKK